MGEGDVWSPLTMARGMPRRRLLERVPHGHVGVLGLSRKLLVLVVRSRLGGLWVLGGARIALVLGVGTQLLGAALVPSIDLCVRFSGEDVPGKIWRERLASLGVLQVPFLDSMLQKADMLVGVE